MAKLGFGFLRFPTIEDELDEFDLEKVQAMVDEYMKGDFCYFDLHPGYLKGKAEEFLRKFVVEKYDRSSFMVANKVPHYVQKEEDYNIIFNNSLKTCNVTYFDYYLLHALTKSNASLHEKLGGFRFLNKLKEQGLVKKIGFFFHDTADVLDEILSNHPEMDFVQLQINYLDWNDPVIQSRKCYEVARKHNKPIFVMEPIKGGFLSNLDYIKDQSLPTAKQLAKIALQFVSSLQGIDIILSGMSEVCHIQENRITLSKDEADNSLQIEALREVIKKNKRIQCTACRYCERECPKKISIPDIISLLNSYEHVGAHDISYISRAKILYNGLITEEKGKASECIKCGKCEINCPQKLKIRKYMNEAKTLFEMDSNSPRNYYTNERNVQILIYLLKVHGIHKLVISPGSANVAFSYSVQYDGDFEIYSCVDERSAAYLACGLAAETGEAVVLNCTGATASRNYFPALTEAYYRKLPILAITATQFTGNIGNLIPQVIDRSVQPNDIVTLSVDIPIVKSDEDEWNAEIKINQALLELKRAVGGGPVHINLQTSWTCDFSVKKLPEARIIDRITVEDNFPILNSQHVGIFVGSHLKWDKKLTDSVDAFCESHNAVVLYDHTSNYHGKYGVLATIILSNDIHDLNDFELLIHIGNTSGAYYPIKTQEVWRVNPDGEIRDTFKKLKFVFEMKEITFFESYCQNTSDTSTHFAKQWQNEYERLIHQIPELPFSNIWAAQQTSSKIPCESVIHFGILNSLRSWNFFELPKTVYGYCNTGGFGIDGCVSSLIGASLADANKIYYGIVGDLAFFYDMNSLGNRHISSNIRLMIINNGTGVEMKLKRAANFLEKFGNDVDDFIAAKGHYGQKSSTLIKDYVTNLGFEYMCATDKETFMQVLERFTLTSITEKPMVLELFVNELDESAALDMIENIEANKQKKNFDNLVISKERKTVIHPQSLHNSDSKQNVVVWGRGVAFKSYIDKVQEKCHVSYVCDNDNTKWGKKIYGIECISPQKLLELENVFVVIMLKNIDTAFQVGNQLLDMGISHFDSVFNFLQYDSWEWFL
ncbi:MAG: aldo/keto reductase [Clostridium sp.]|nr:aldo/keto reductase [Clostridium sp.]